MEDMQSPLASLVLKPEFQSGKGASDAVIQKMERQLHVEFDDDYRSFLKRYGYALWFGGSLCGYFELDEENLPGYDFDTVRLTRDARREELPDGATAFPLDANVLCDDDAGGYFVLFSKSSKTPGRVVWFDYAEVLGPIREWQSFAEYLQWVIEQVASNGEED